MFSYTFYLKDSHGRGLSRFYSVVVVMRDKVFLLNSWPFLVDHMRAIIWELQRKAAVVYAEEQIKNPQKPQLLGSSLATGKFRFARGGQQKPARSLIDLTNDKMIFPKMHQAFTNVLRQGGQRVRELLVEGPPTEDAIIDFEKQEETEEGFVKLFTKSISVEEEGDMNPALTPEENHPTIPCFTDVRHLASVLGKPSFHTLAYHTVIGNQVIVRGDQKKVVRSVIDCLQSLLPKGCCRVIYHSDTYQDSWRCNFLGYPPSGSLPDHADLYVCLYVMSSDSAHGGGQNNVQPGLLGTTGQPGLLGTTGQPGLLGTTACGNLDDTVESGDDVLGPQSRLCGALSKSGSEPHNPLHLSNSLEDESFPFVSIGDQFSASDPFAGYKFTVHSTCVLPEREPAVLAKFETALWTQDTPNSVVEHWLISIKEEWMNKVKVGVYSQYCAYLLIIQNFTG